MMTDKLKESRERREEHLQNLAAQKTAITEAQLARLASEFLNKTPLTGAEVPVFVHVQQWLSRFYTDAD